MGDEDMADGAQTRGRVEAAGGNRRQIAADALPKQAGAALAAEAAMGEARRLVPAQATLLGEAKVGAGGSGIGADMAVKAPALAAMAIHHLAQRAGDAETDGAAFAMAGDRCRLVHRS